MEESRSRWCGGLEKTKRWEGKKVAALRWKGSAGVGGRKMADGMRLEDGGRRTEVGGQRVMRNVLQSMFTYRCYGMYSIFA